MLLSVTDWLSVVFWATRRLLFPLSASGKSLAAPRYTVEALAERIVRSPISRKL
jgi:hypothetical protein